MNRLHLQSRRILSPRVKLEEHLESTAIIDPQGPVLAVHHAPLYRRLWSRIQLALPLAPRLISGPVQQPSVSQVAASQSDVSGTSSQTAAPMSELGAFSPCEVPTGMHLLDLDASSLPSYSILMPESHAGPSPASAPVKVPQERGPEVAGDTDRVDPYLTAMASLEATPPSVQPKAVAPTNQNVRNDSSKAAQRVVQAQQHEPSVSKSNKAMDAINDVFGLSGLLRWVLEGFRDKAWMALKGRIKGRRSRKVRSRRTRRH